MVAVEDVEGMRARLFFEGPEVRARVSRLWLLLILAAIIASAGVAGDSTATVIGAMIVAPLMTPILGIVLSMVLNDRHNLLRSGAMVVAGGLAVVALGYLLRLVVVEPVTAVTNSQVAARISPHLVDLLAALATGAVGSIALIRSDVSDALAGVAISISLVPTAIGRRPYVRAAGLQRGRRSFAAVLGQCLGHSGHRRRRNGRLRAPRTRVGTVAALEATRCV